MLCGWMNLRIEIIKRNQFLAELLRDLIWQEKLLFQKFKSQWRRDDNVNSSYFHRWINRRYKIIEITRLFFDDIWTKSVDEVKTGVFQYFEDHYKEKFPLASHCRMTYFPTSSGDSKINLHIASFTESEIKQALWSCDSGKSLGPGGFSFDFFKKY